MAWAEWDKGPTLHASLPDTRIQAPEERSPGILEVMGAAMRRENPIGSYIANQTFGDGLDPFEIEEGFNTLDYVRKRWGDAFEAEHGDRFLDVFNRRYADALKSQIDMEVEDRKTLDAAGGGGIAAELFAGLLDPTNLLPGGTAVRSAKAGKAIFGTAARTSAAGALAASVSEVALHGSQELRTGEESLFAIGGSAILMGAIGASFGARRG